MNINSHKSKMQFDETLTEFGILTESAKHLSGKDLSKLGVLNRAFRDCMTNFSKGLLGVLDRRLEGELKPLKFTLFALPRTPSKKKATAEITQTITEKAWGILGKQFPRASGQEACDVPILESFFTKYRTLFLPIDTTVVSGKSALKALLRIEPQRLKNVPNELKADEALVLSIVRKDGMALQFASELLRANKNVVLAAVGQNGQALQFASKELKRNPEVVLQAVLRDGMALKFADSELKKNVGIVMAAVSQSGRAILFSDSKELENNYYVALAAVSQDGYALKTAKEFQDNRDIVLAAVTQEPNAVQYASDRLLNDPEIRKQASKNPSALRNARPLFERPNPNEGGCSLM